MQTHTCRTLAGILTLSLLGWQAHATPLVFQIQTEAGQALPDAAISVFVKGTPAKAPSSVLANMGQRNKAFTPTLLIVQTGTSVHFPNFDTVRHHVYSFSPTKTFEIKLYAGTPAAPVVFDKPGTATMGCNIHDKMLGYIHVVDTPYFGVTDASGRVTLDIPEGEHRIRVWTPAMGEANAGLEQTFKSGNTPVSIAIKIK
jgi:plastocyanin